MTVKATKDVKLRAETGDSQAVDCPMCKGTGEHPLYAGQPCPTCQASGFLLQQRVDANGRPTRLAGNALAAEQAAVTDAPGK